MEGQPRWCTQQSGSVRRYWLSKGRHQSEGALTPSLAAAASHQSSRAELQVPGLSQHQASVRKGIQDATLGAAAASGRKAEWGQVRDPQ